MALPASFVQAQEASSARAVLRDSQGNIVGNALLRETQDGVRIQVRMENVDVASGERGEHGFHIHEVGQCDAPDFQSAGSHYNPTGEAHGLLDPDGAHAGDLPNLWIEADGTADYAVTTDLVSLAADSDRTLLDEDGSAIILHQQLDDYITDPSGESGDHLACGVVELE